MAAYVEEALRHVTRPLQRPGFDGADARFKRDFLDRSFGHSDRLWFHNNLSKVGSVQNERQHNAAIGVLRRQFSNNTNDFLQFAVCSACKEALTSGKVPVMSVSNGYRYPPKREHLPALNPVEERIIAPRLPFMSIRRLTHGNGQYGIKRQVVNVLIDVQELAQCLPRNVPDDEAIDVHIKRKLVSKASYRRGLVKKSSGHAGNLTLLFAPAAHVSFAETEGA
ncbi:hypothetical protein HPB49_023835 [Dermacentor silvarum]|uniref:Uncharacterized protein n=1 Tax=Dermacentor silvarum TaxID=543639 RepID=A0ACB8CTJ7_DERSI|nr:hypothetical protein HPB49_023835 [Dermacentor silvarum]